MQPQLIVKNTSAYLKITETLQSQNKTVWKLFSWNFLECPFLELEPYYIIQVLSQNIAH